MVNEINTGQVVVGNVPASNLGYSIKNTPYDRHIWAQRRISLGLPVGELPDERQARIREENRRLDALLLN